MTLVKNKETIMLKNVPNLIPPSSFLFSLQNFVFTLSIHSRSFWFHLLKNFGGDWTVYWKKSSEGHGRETDAFFIIVNVQTQNIF